MPLSGRCYSSDKGGGTGCSRLLRLWCQRKQTKILPKFVWFTLEARYEDHEITVYVYVSCWCMLCYRSVQDCVIMYVHAFNDDDGEEMM